MDESIETDVAVATTNGIYYECRYCDLFGKELNMVAVLSGFVVFDIL